jgi:predicted RNase H-like HicB family nuclease
MKYTVIIEKGPTNYGAYIPDLPGCVAVADTREEVISLIREAVIFHMEGMVEDGETIPEPTSAAIEVEVQLPGAPEEVAAETGG